MTTILSPSLAETQFSGQYGNSAVATATYNPNAPQINDTVILMKLYAGTKITGMDFQNGTIGAGTSMNIGYQFVDGSAGNSLTQFFAAQNTAATGRTRSTTRPIQINKDFYIVGTFLGAAGAAASVANYLDIIVEYEFRNV